LQGPHQFAQKSTSNEISVGWYDDQNPAT
jgi:hypothetical protein